MTPDADSPINQNNSKSQHVSKILLIVIIIIGFITTFTSGYYLAYLLASEKNVTTKTKTKTQNKNIPSISNAPLYPTTNPQDVTKFLPGKHFFDDSIILITKNKPQITVVATVIRTEQEHDYAQNTRVSYHDGSNWTRQIDSKTTPDSTIVGNSLVKQWTTTLDPSRVLKQKAHGEITINNSSLKFSTGDLHNEIAMRSLPGYTKFLSNGSGTLTINGTTHQAYVLYTRIYSLNAADIQFYDQSLGVTTDWIAFWDTQGNFYHVDATSVNKPTTKYQSHQLGVMEDTIGTVTKTFRVSTKRDTTNPPSQFTVSVNSPIGATLNLNRINGLDKAPNKSYTWYMGNIEGTVQKANGEVVNGTGLVEYIQD